MKIERWFEGNCLGWAFGVWSPGGCRYLLAREQIWVWFATLVRWLKWQTFLCACFLRGDFSIYYQLLLDFHSCCAPGRETLGLSSHLQPSSLLSFCQLETRVLQNRICWIVTVKKKSNRIKTINRDQEPSNESQFLRPLCVFFLLFAVLAISVLVWMASVNYIIHV